MAKQEKEVEKWITVNGARVPIFKDGSVGGPKAIADKIKKGTKVNKNSKDKEDKTKQKEADDAYTDYINKMEYQYERAFLMGVKPDYTVQKRLIPQMSTKKLEDEYIKSGGEIKKAIGEELEKRNSQSSKQSKQIDKDFDTKEKQIAKNKAEKEELSGKTPSKVDKAAEMARKELDFDRPGDYAEIAANQWSWVGMSNDKMAEKLSQIDPKYEYEHAVEQDGKIIHHRLYRIPKEGKKSGVNTMEVKKNFGRTATTAQKRISQYDSEDLKEVAVECGFSNAQVSKMSFAELKAAILAIYKRK